MAPTGPVEKYRHGRGRSGSARRRVWARCECLCSPTCASKASAATCRWAATPRRPAPLTPSFLADRAAGRLLAAARDLLAASAHAAMTMGYGWSAEAGDSALLDEARALHAARPAG